MTTKKKSNARTWIIALGCFFAFCFVFFGINVSPISKSLVDVCGYSPNHQELVYRICLNQNKGLLMIQDILSLFLIMFGAVTGVLYLAVAHLLKRID